MTKVPTPYSRKGRGRPANQGPTLVDIHEAELEAQAQRAEERVANYRAAWEAEKTLRLAQYDELAAMRGKLSQVRAVAFLRGAAFGGCLFGLLGCWLGLYVFIR